MGKLNIKNGTPVGSASTCESCRFAQIMRGYRESELLVYCDYISPSILVPFKLSSCTNFGDKNRPDWEQMEKLAIDVMPISSAKPAGFRVVGKPDENIVLEPETINE